jgi:hypothetical protein
MNISWVRMMVCGCVMAPLIGFAADIPGNLAPNPSFELPENGAGQLPEGWRFFASKPQKIALTDKVAASGKQSLMMTALGAPQAFQGVTCEVPVKEGEKYTFEVKYLADKDDRPGGTLDLRLVVELKRENGSEVARPMSQPVKASQFSRLRWETLALRKLLIPKDVVKVVAGIHLCDNERGGSGTVYLDDMVILKN